MGIPEGVHRTHRAYSQIGISKLDYFASAALTGILASQEKDPNVNDAVSLAFRLAKAMLQKSEENNT